MRKFLLHFSLATAVSLLTLAFVPSMHAQQADQDRAPATPQQADATAAQQQQQNEAQMPSSGDTTTREAQTFSGRIVKEKGELVLKDPVSKVSYKLDDPAKAKQYLGKQVKVTGKLDMNSNTIQVDGIEPLS
jgi:uncharacterized protein YdeI (BOF family)